MPHQTLKLTGGVIETETPVINQAGIAVSNRIRFKPDPQGLSLPEKLGGWAKFYASTITTGIIRALWGWQDTNNNQWIAFAGDSATSHMNAIQCTVSNTTGLTTATGSLLDITPNTISSQNSVKFSTTAGSNIVTIIDNNLTISTPPRSASVYITTPVSVGGIVLNGIYQIVPQSAASSTYSIIATDILGNPLNAIYTNLGTTSVGSVAFSAGPPHTLVFSWSGPALPVGENVNVFDSTQNITGSYVIVASAANSFTVVTPLAAYSFGGTVTFNMSGVVPIYNVTAGSYVITVTFPDHGQSVGSTWYVLNPTLVSGITIYGAYVVQNIANSYTFTIFANKNATGFDSYQYQNAATITGGTHVGTAETLQYATIYSKQFQSGGAFTGGSIYVQGNNNGTWDTFPSGGTVTAGTTGSPNTITFTGNPVGGYTGGGSFAPIGGMVGFVYNFVQLFPNPVYNPGTFWTLDSWGNDLVAVAGNAPIINYTTNPLEYQPIYIWDATSGLQAQALPFGPQASTGAFVAMPQRQIVAWGTTFSGLIDPLLIRWCDVNNFNTWVAQTTNQAGSFRLPSGASIIGARQVQQQGLIWTDIELWAMQYISQPYVYGFNKIGLGCGLIGKYAHGVLGGIVYWMGKTQIWMLSGEGPVPIPCPVWDVVFQDLDLVNVNKITCATNAMFQEVAWYFPVKSGSGENSQYIKYNVQTQTWDFGTLDRSAWIDVSVLQQPIGFSPVNHLIYQHEISPDADGAAMGETFTTGWFALAEGDVMPFVDQWWPDMKWGYYGQTQNASVTLTINGVDYPGGTPQSLGPYTVNQATQYISPRIRRRLLNFTVSGTGTGTWWRLGGTRYRYQQDGKY